MVWSVTAAFLAGALGGIITNEYFIAYLVDLMGGKIQENDPIVKRVVEEKVYVESSQNIDAVKKMAPALLSVQVGDKRTNGFMVTADGLLMTYVSVLPVKPEGADYKVTLRGGVALDAGFVAKDDKTGVVLLKVNKTAGQSGNLAYPVVEFADVSKMEPAQTVLTLEMVADSSLELVNQGVMREYGYKASLKDYTENAADKLKSFTFVADVKSHNYPGGPLLNLSGQVAGMAVDASADGEVILSANELRYLLENFLKNGKFARPEFGISYSVVPYGVETGLPGDLFKAVNFAAVIKSVKAGSFAEKAGLKVGDKVISVNDKPIILEEGLYNVLLRYQPGDVATAKVLRDDKEVSVELKF